MSDLCAARAHSGRVVTGRVTDVSTRAGSGSARVGWLQKFPEGRGEGPQWKVLLMGRQWEAVLCRVHKVGGQAAFRAKMGCCQGRERQEGRQDGGEAWWCEERPC